MKVFLIQQILQSQWPYFYRHRSHGSICQVLCRLDKIRGYDTDQNFKILKMDPLIFWIKLLYGFWPQLCMRTLTSPLAMNPLSSWSFNLNNSLILSTVNCSSKFTFFLWNISIIIFKMIRCFWPSRACPRLSVSSHDVWTISFYLDLDMDRRLEQGYW